MKSNNEIRKLSRELLRASFTDGQLDSGRVSSLVRSLLERKPRNYVAILQAYKRLLRLEIEKRTAIIETAAELTEESAQQIVDNLKRRYGNDLAPQFVINPELLGGMRIRVGNDVWDSSVRNRLHRLAQTL
jgi:F-type H+-transporting ATPase subunit delta